ncbi:NAD-P-binding protein [Rhodofomes roseus]|uniref:NAD-P-binding protein n=1 Tax=Rhodofomes roseus TaxID=34475 RepID=A0ABQ8KT09_9APHY|nr:NAD-P-binding protein [Rhodofomes roseus]KAH9840971.1 NAD-P-binding protein [Rhodofomes roseus]
MAPIRNARVLFNSIPAPNTYPEPGKTTVYDDSRTIDLETVPLDGGFLVKTLVFSIDPYMRGRMREPSAQDSYSPPFTLGEPLANFAVGLVVRSEHSAVKMGDHIYGFLPFQEYTVVPDPAHIRPDIFRILEAKEGVPWSAYVGVCGMAGSTAHHGWHEYAHAKPGETVFVTSAAGPVGGTVVQLAKADGLKVIASAGSDEKVSFVESLGADVVFNYKKEDTRTVLQREGGIDIYWDNVGGHILEAALDAAHNKARFIECGMISAYNGEPYGPKNLTHIISKELKINGFVVRNLYPKYRDQFYKEIPPMVASGQVKYMEDRSYGLESVGEAIVSVQKGTNKGKKVVIVTENK